MSIGIFINGERGVSVSRSVYKKRKIKIIFCLKSLPKKYHTEISKLNIPVFSFIKYKPNYYKINLIIIKL